MTLVRHTIAASCAPVYIVMPETEADSVLGARSSPNLEVTIVPLEHGPWNVFIVKRAECLATKREPDTR